MEEYLAEVHRIENFFDGFEVQYVPWLDNRDVDHQAWIASYKAPTPPDVIIKKLFKPSVKPTEATNEAVKQNMMVIDNPDQEPEYDWIHPIRIFLEN
jgi:hypothetical protein